MGVINDIIFKAWSWVPWVLGLGTVGWLALALLAPGLLSVFSPILKGISELIVEGIRALIEGVIDILDSWKTIATVMVIIWLFGNYWTWTEPKAAPTKPAITKAQPKKVETLDLFSRWPWEW